MGFFHVLALSIANIQHSISKNVLIIVNMGSLLKKKKWSSKLLRLYKLGVEMLPPLFGCQGTTTKDCRSRSIYFMRVGAAVFYCNQMFFCSQLFVARKSKVIFSTD